MCSCLDNLVQLIKSIKAKQNRARRRLYGFALLVYFSCFLTVLCSFNFFFFCKLLLFLILSWKTRCIYQQHLALHFLLASYNCTVVLLPLFLFFFSLFFLIFSFLKLSFGKMQSASIIIKRALTAYVRDLRIPKCLRPSGCADKGTLWFCKGIYL